MINWDVRKKGKLHLPGEGPYAQTLCGRTFINRRVHMLFGRAYGRRYQKKALCKVCFKPRQLGEDSAGPQGQERGE